MGDEAQSLVGEMHKRRTTLEDGRYLIYYTFGDEAGAARESEGGESGEGRESKPEPSEPRPVAGEERSV